MNQNWQVGDKVKMINRLMNRIVGALGDVELPGSTPDGEIFVDEKPAAPAMSLLSFISACKGMKSTGGGQNKSGKAASTVSTAKDD